MRLPSLLLGAALVFATWSASAAELVMLRRAGCPFCAAWDRAIGPIYPKTDAGRAAPLRMLDLDREPSPEGLTRPARYTPTFVLMTDGREIGRIEGYPGEDFFWGLLDTLIRKLPGPERNAEAPAARL